MNEAKYPGTPAEDVAFDENFQAACQRYAHGNGSSVSIAAAALRAAGIGNALPELRAARALCVLPASGQQEHDTSAQDLRRRLSLVRDAIDAVLAKAGDAS